MKVLRPLDPAPNQTAAVEPRPDPKMKTVPIGLCSLAEHILNFGLPVPITITPPLEPTAAIAVEVRWPDVNTWLDSVHVDETTAVIDVDDIVMFSVRLPALGIRVEISAVREPSEYRFLRVVTES